MEVTFASAEAPRVYVERVDVNGNTLTQDKVVRREFRLAEGDAFNTLPGQAFDQPHQVAGLFPGEVRDRAEAGQRARPHRARGQRRGKGRPASSSFRPASPASKASSSRPRSSSATSAGAARRSALSVNYSRYSQQRRGRASPSPICSIATSRPGVDIYRRDFNSFNFLNNNRNTTFKQTTTGFQVARSACR